MTWTHEGIEITVGDHGYFSFEGGNNKYATLDAAKAAAGAYCARKAAVGKVRLAIPAISEGGVACAVTGIDARNNCLTTKPPVRGTVYYATEAAKQLVAEQIHLQKRLDETEQRLASLKIGDYGTRYQGNPQDIADRWAELQKSEVEAVNQ